MFIVEKRNEYLGDINDGLNTSHQGSSNWELVRFNWKNLDNLD